MRISFMRWRPGSDGREPRERRKWLEINGVPSRVRFRMFIRNRLWIGLPPAFVAGFGVVLLLLVSGGESTPERSLVRASIAGGLCVFGWILGVWAATGPDPEADSNAENPEQASGGSVCSPRVAMVAVGSLRGAAICYAVFSPSIGRIVEGERTVLEGAAEIVSKVLTVVCVDRSCLVGGTSPAVTSSGRIRSAGTVFPCRSLPAVFRHSAVGRPFGRFFLVSLRRNGFLGRCGIFF